MSQHSQQQLEALAQRTVEYLAFHNRRIGSHGVAQQFDIPYHTAQSVICKLIMQNRIHSSGRCTRGRPLYQLSQPTQGANHE